MHKCYDCGSVLVGHHTPKCEMAPTSRTKRDLPAYEHTQWWTGEIPTHLESKFGKTDPAFHAERIARFRALLAA